MVKRYPHIATITLYRDGEIVDGTWVEGGKETIIVEGRLDPIDTNQIIRRDNNGEEKVVRAEFYCNHPAIVNINGELSIKILGIEKARIICWWPWQSHSVISI